MGDHLPAGVRITEVVRETPSVSTIWFDFRFSFNPGQFVMVWVPGVDEIPMALTSPSSITVQKAGDATTALLALEAGEMIGIRGPFGNGFELKHATLAIAGGVGAAPLLPLAMTGVISTFILGARTANELLFRKRLNEVTELKLMTDDGSAGNLGFAVQGMDGLSLDSYSQVCVCGPEKMMSAVLLRLHEEGLLERGKFSLHRYMKCGCGVCGSCCIDPSGLRVCREGPVFSGEQLIISEFGHYSRDGSGRRRPV
ncbi:MAG: dihydroorotate dehydrogenase electron transfer subunit [Methanomicrobiales archaeon]